MSGPESRKDRRSDIQGLRAVAVLLVVIYHAVPTAVRGGFVGVDVFFVISGFLISLLLFRELGTSGRISLSTFYARRIRRLMPAALVATVATLAVASLVYGPLVYIKILQDAAWASVSLANVHFAGKPDGYFATSDPSPFLHFWSLAVEEQFYLVWPLVILVSYHLGRRRPTGIAWVLGLIFVGSLVLSIVFTNRESAHAYYSLPSRAWELAMGAIVAYVWHYHGLRLSTTLRAIVGAVGASMIVAAAVMFSSSTPFPGWTALIPTVGAALVVMAGTGGESGPVGAVLSWRPMQFIGNISYSLYLWHWPVLILAVPILHARLNVVQALICVGIAAALATASYYWVERPASSFRRHLPRRKVVVAGVAFAVVACLVPAGVAASVPVTGGPAVGSPAPLVPIAGHGATPPILPGPGKAPDAVPADVNPTLGSLATIIPSVSENGCMTNSGHAVVCEGGDPDGEISIALVGDSHAAQWYSVVDRIASREGWKLYFIGKNSCPLALVEVSRDATSEPWPACTQWQAEALAKTVALDSDLVIWAANANFYREYKTSTATDFEAKWRAGVTAALTPIAEVSDILYIGQIPYWDVQPADCLVGHLQDVAACSLPIDDAVPPQVRALSEELASTVGATYFDPAPMLCTQVCAVMDHNQVMYRDISHVSEVYATHLEPSIQAMLLYALG
ncbi:MAG: acyltransferase family protein [Microbacterium sp.]